MTSDIDKLCIDTIRTLAIDAVEKASSGHPGTPMALAPQGYLLWTRYLRHNPLNPAWFDRDRFVLSNGHASMLLYSLLFLTGYALTRSDLQDFRQWRSRTPGHPEHGVTPGVETTTGPLGQGLMNAVGMAMAEAHLAAVYNRPGHAIVDHRTWVMCGDGDLMEGASHEAASLAGHLALGKLTCLYDDNRITIEGSTPLAFSENVEERFRAYGWHVQNLGEAAEDLDRLSAALDEAVVVADRPSLVIVRSRIGFGAPKKQDTPAAHGEPLGREEAAAAKHFFGFPEEETFRVPSGVPAHMRSSAERGERLEEEWHARFAEYAREYPREAELFRSAIAAELPAGWDADLPLFSAGEKIATRAASGKVLNALAKKVHFLVGGSADLAPSTKTLLAGETYFSAADRAGRNIAWGVREHAMCGCSSGMALHGGVRPFASTFFVFTDYARPAIRLAALMELPVVYVMTHDSLAVGEDGPTHQPVEHLASLRAMPNLRVIRPADANETTLAWRAAMEHRSGPTLLALTRQNLPVIDRSVHADAAGLLRGAYVLAPESGEVPDVILIGTGSEVHLCLEAREVLASEGIDARVVSMPCVEIFGEQPLEYRENVLPTEVRARVSVEAGSALGWREWVGDAGETVAVDRFGASAPGETVLERYGFTAEGVVAAARRALETVQGKR